MSVFGPKNTGDLLVGSTYETEADVAAFISGADDGSLQVFSGDGSAVAAGQPFKVLQKSSASKAGFEFSENINPSKVNYVKAEAYSAPVARSLRVEGFTGTVRDNCTYEVFVRVLNDGGSISPENFRMIPAFYVSPADASGVAMADVLNELKSNLEKTLAKESDGQFTISVDTVNGYFIVTGSTKPFILGKKDGRPSEFYLQSAVRSNGSELVTSGNRYDDLTVVTVAEGNGGTGTGVQAANLEWFYKGYKYSRYRTAAYPSEFPQVYNVDASSTYHVVVVGYYESRDTTNVEKQPRTLYILVDATAGVVAVNALIADLETATGLTIPDLV